MKVTEVIGDDFYQELPGTRGNWAPYIVRRLQTPHGEEYGVYQQGHKIASAKLSQDRSFITDVSVLPEHQRRGIARALYAHIETQIGHPLQPSPLHQTDAGRGFWQGRRSQSSKQP